MSTVECPAPGRKSPAPFLRLLSCDRIGALVSVRFKAVPPLAVSPRGGRLYDGLTLMNFGSPRAISVRGQAALMVLLPFPIKKKQPLMIFFTWRTL